MVVAAVSGCSAGPASDAGAAERIVVVVGERGLSLNPYSPRLADRRVGRLLFRGLMTVGPEGDPAPDLALEVPTAGNGGIRDGGRTVVYHIRSGVEWHDGTPLTARDVAFTVRLVAEGHLVDDPSERSDAVTGVRAVDDRTVEVSFSRPDSVLAWRLAPYVLPEHILKTSPDLTGDAYWRDPVGSGAYRVEDLALDGTLDLAPVADDAPFLRIRPSLDEADAMRAFNDADTAVWLDATGDPASASESLSTTWGPVWKSMVFSLAPDSPWRDESLRRAVAAMTTASIPATMPASAYPYGVRPPSVTVPDTRVAAAAFEAAGFRTTLPDGTRTRDGERLDLVVGMPSVRPEEEERTVGVMRLWGSAGMHGPIITITGLIRPAWTEFGDVPRTTRAAYLYPFPAGRPWGWAFPYVEGDEPSWERPWGLNFAHLSDARVQSAYAAARRAPDPSAARSHVAEAGRRIYELAMQIDIEPVPERVLYKGVSGVRAWPSRDEALAQATTWRVTPRESPEVP